MTFLKSFKGSKIYIFDLCSRTIFWALFNIKARLLCTHVSL